MKTTIVTHNAQQTRAFGSYLATLLSGGELIFLDGVLGSGKTTFTQGLALGLGIEGPVSSPTFTLMKEYQGRHWLIHIDAYRLEGIDQDLGFEDYLDGESIVIIEWAKFIEHHLEKPTIQILIEYQQNDERLIHIEASPTLIKEIESYVS